MYCATASLSDAVTGGIWSSYNTNVTILSGLMTTISPGTDTITYSIVTTCGIAVASTVVNVLPITGIAGTISGTTPICADTSVTYTDMITVGYGVSQIQVLQ